VAWLDCELTDEHPGGDHVVAICQVLDLAARTDIRPLVFFQSDFQRIMSNVGAPVGDVSSVVLSVGDMDRAYRYYSEGLGLIPLSRDGDRWATFSGGRLTTALAGGEYEIESDICHQYQSLQCGGGAGASNLRRW
jgi:hypothetical protein